MKITFCSEFGICNIILTPEDEEEKMFNRILEREVKEGTLKVGSFSDYKGTYVREDENDGSLMLSLRDNIFVEKSK